jgi:hypothetical protein
MATVWRITRLGSFLIKYCAQHERQALRLFGAEQT